MTIEKYEYTWFNSGQELSTRESSVITQVSAWVFSGDLQCALVSKSEGEDAWELPGGKPEPGESPLATLQRELKEEIGLSAAPYSMLELGFHLVTKSTGGSFRQLRFLCHIEKSAQSFELMPRPTDSVRRARWHPAEDLPKRLPCCASSPELVALKAFCFGVKRK